MKKLLGCFFCAMLLVFGASVAGATLLDLTDYGRGDTGMVNGATFVVFTDAMQETVSSGTGVIDPFLSIQANCYEEGFNTDAKPPPLDTKRMGDTGNKGWTHSITMNDLIYDATYQGYEFLLDINEPKDNHSRLKDPSDPQLWSLHDNSLLTMHEMEIYVVPSGVAANEFNDYSQLSGYKVWDLDVGGDGESTVDLDYAFWQGSGNNMDLAVYIPETLLAGANPDDWIILYSAFGNDGGVIEQWNMPSKDGFEEWVLRTKSVPEPATMLLLGTGLVVLAGFGRKKFKV